ncbi:hypothetical protein QBC33DRAFT_548473 [Phialemonium atrogriseum]|uniref:Uncharacterized protein n=1 Tax=Phialemonium atrogriseum TaxID=1093897 RepID=A0AAJ0BT33_9PEZI|nr:uncharacterized protein QBC33DRAFT_548473 [Phialemonium atrogriseum]KAK1763989.1 hypothetical protein QBC33DRAFT_548473 [Phialemonium atrogriseum]
MRSFNVPILLAIAAFATAQDVIGIFNRDNQCHHHSDHPIHDRLCVDTGTAEYEPAFRLILPALVPLLTWAILELFLCLPTVFALCTGMFPHSFK